MLASRLSHFSVPANKTKAQSTAEVLVLLFCPLFVLFFSFSSFPLKAVTACSCLDGGQKFWHCVV